MVLFLYNDVTPIFPEFLVLLTYLINWLGFVELFSEKAFETKYASLHVFLATAAASQMLFQSVIELVLSSFYVQLLPLNFALTSPFKPCMNKSFRSLFTRYITSLKKVYNITEFAP